VYTLRGLVGHEIQTDDLTGGAFLDRALAARERGDADASRAACAGSLVVRAAARLLRPDAPGDVPAVAWELAEAQRQLAPLAADDLEAGHLRAVLRALRALEGRPEALDDLRPALAGYAGFLEEENRACEALALLALAGHAWNGMPPSEELVALALAAGRLHLLLMHWEPALAAYRAAAEAAAEAGDLAAGVAAWLGQARVLAGQGRLAEARSELEAVILESRLLGRSDLEARAFIDLAAVLRGLGEPAAALGALYEAVCRSESPAERAPRLLELAVGLRGLGAHDAARNAAERLLAEGARGALRVAAHLELMQVAAESGRRAEFERHRDVLRGLAHWMTPATAVDARWRAAAGLASFGEAAAARDERRAALALAERHRLTDWRARLLAGGC
jgi:tetratricopeptide (TPR) repeat protein